MKKHFLIILLVAVLLVPIRYEIEAIKAVPTDMIASRLLDTTYNNGSNRPILVFSGGEIHVVAGAGTRAMLFGAIGPAGGWLSQQFAQGVETCIGNEELYYGVAFIVPPFYDYTIATVMGGANHAHLQTWWEVEL